MMMLLYAWLFFDARLYSLVLLHGVSPPYTCMAAVAPGGDDSGQRSVSSAAGNEIVIGLTTGLLLGLGLAMNRLTQAVYSWPAPCSPPSAYWPSNGWHSSAGSAGRCGL